jgi:putative tricarboxylic transport membrane protein
MKNLKLISALVITSVIFCQPVIAAVKPANIARVGDQCLREGVLAPTRGINGTDLVCMKATLGSSKGELLWWYPSLKSLNMFELIAPIVSRSSDPAEVIASRSADKIANLIGANLKNEQLTKEYSAKNFTGGYGSLALTTFQSYKNRTSTSFVANSNLLTNLAANKSSISLLKSKPVANLITEYEAIAVTTNSRFSSLEQLVNEINSNSTKITFIGGPKSGSDELFLRMFLSKINISFERVNFQSTNSGFELLNLLNADRNKVAISVNGDFVNSVNANKVRILGIASPARLNWIKGKTLQSQNIDLIYGNWYGILAPGNLPESDFNNLLSALEVLHNSQMWKKTIQENYWNDDFLYPNDFQAKIVNQNLQTSQLFSS